ncbi:hypothetical protein, partial [Lelliottia jeotgali]
SAYSQPHTIPVRILASTLYQSGTDWSGFGNHGLWFAFLGFMALRALTLGWVGWRLQRKRLWIH